MCEEGGAKPGGGSPDMSARRDDAVASIRIATTSTRQAKCGILPAVPSVILLHTNDGLVDEADIEAKYAVQYAIAPLHWRQLYDGKRVDKPNALTIKTTLRNSSKRASSIHSNVINEVIKDVEEREKKGNRFTLRELEPRIDRCMKESQTLLGFYMTQQLMMDLKAILSDMYTTAELIKWRKSTRRVIRDLSTSTMGPDYKSLYDSLLGPSFLGCENRMKDFYENGLYYNNVQIMQRFGDTVDTKTLDTVLEAYEWHTKEERSSLDADKLKAAYNYAGLVTWNKQEDKVLWVCLCAHVLPIPASSSNQTDALELIIASATIGGMPSLIIASAITGGMPSRMYYPLSNVNTRVRRAVSALSVTEILTRWAVRFEMCGVFPLLPLAKFVFLSDRQDSIAVQLVDTNNLSPKYVGVVPHVTRFLIMYRLAVDMLQLEREPAIWAFSKMAEYLEATEQLAKRQLPTWKQLLTGRQDMNDLIWIDNKAEIARLSRLEETLKTFKLSLHTAMTTLHATHNKAKPYTQDDLWKYYNLCFRERTIGIVSNELLYLDSALDAYKVEDNIQAVFDHLVSELLHMCVRESVKGQAALPKTTQDWFSLINKWRIETATSIVSMILKKTPRHTAIERAVEVILGTVANGNASSLPIEFQGDHIGKVPHSSEMQRIVSVCAKVSFVLCYLLAKGNTIHIDDAEWSTLYLEL